MAGGGIAVTSIDAMIEGVHFRLGDGWATPAEVGHRALAGALSDLAAMGAGPGEAFIALGLSSGFAESDALALVSAADDLACETGTVIAGGDVVAAPALMVTVSVNGWIGRGEKPVGRAGAVLGDLVGVTGALGAAGAALAVMEGRASRGPRSEPALALARRPFPRLREGRALAAAGASAVIDISDGLAADAAQIGRASLADLRMQLERLPLAPGVAAVADELGLAPTKLAATGGEDYELLFCAPPEARAAIDRALSDAGGAAASWIGEVAAGEPGATLLGRGGDVVRAEGFEHRW
jgi:thiamine-monophosphate kinase